MDLNINQCKEIVKRIKKNKKSTKKDSFINDSSSFSEDDLDLRDVDWLPKTRSMCRKVNRKDKITPTKKSIYNNLNENSRCTKKKSSKQKIPVH